jgi:nucleoside-diphosphate-sugar epimerase
VSRVLLFGASGFIGRHVREALATAVDLVCPGRADCDLLDVGVPGLTRLVRDVAPDAVVNCTGRLDGGPYELVTANTVVTATLVEAVAAGAPAARLVRIGSAGEYGPVPTGHAVIETDPAHPVSEYGVSHLAATRLVELAHAAGRLDAVVLRVFNPVGPGLPDQTVLGRAALLIRRALAAGADEIALGPLDAYRDFVDVRDVARAVVTLVRSGGPVSPPVLNIGSGRAVAVRHAVRLLAGAAGFTGRIREGLAAAPGAARTAAVPWMCADVSAAARLIGWAPTHDLSESVTAAWAEPATAAGPVVAAQSRREPTAEPG